MESTIQTGKSESGDVSTSGSENEDTKEKFYPGVYLFTTPARFVRPV